MGERCPESFPQIQMITLLLTFTFILIPYHLAHVLHNTIYQYHVILIILFHVNYTFVIVTFSWYY